MTEHSTGNRKDLGSIPSGVEAFLFSQKNFLKNFVFKIWGMVKKIKTDVDRLLLVLKMKNVQFKQNISELFFSLLKPKVIYLRLFLSSLPSPKFWKQNLMNFEHKHVETGPSCPHELATFHKYDMPLRASHWRNFIQCYSSSPFLN